MLEQFKKYSLVALMGGAVAMTSCEDATNTGDITPDIDTEKQVTVKGNATFGNVTTGGRVAVGISQFIVNVKEIELEIDDKDERSATDSVYSDLEFQGPFVLDLLSDSLNVDIAGANIPLGIYNQIGFKVSPSQDATSGINGKSVKIEGDIAGTPFIFWTDQEEKFKVNFPNNGGDFVVDNTGFVLVINFDLDQLFGPNGTVDLSTAQDGNGDGIIEIYPNDPDGNNVLAIKILSGLEESTDIDEDEDFDEDGKGNKEDEDDDGDGINDDEDDDDDNDGVKDEDDDDADGDGKNDDDEDAEDDDNNNGEDDGDKDHDDDENDDEGDQATEIGSYLSVGTWGVSSYTAQEDQTDEFVGMVLTFDSKEDIKVVQGDVEFEGEWEAITNTDTPLLLLEFEDTRNHPLFNLEDDWTIISMDSAKFELQKVKNGYTKSLIIEQN